MTISTIYSAPLVYNGDDSTTAFPVSWPFYTGTLIVTLIDDDGVETTQTISTHYTVSGGTDANGLASTGTVTMITPPATNEQLRIQRSTTKTQATTFATNDPFLAKVIEGAFDKVTMLAQEAGAGASEDATGDVLQLVSGGADPDYWDADSFKLSNLVDAVAAQDAVTLSQLNDAISAAELSNSDIGPTFLQAGASAVAREWQPKVRELYSVADFGAGTGESAGTNLAAFQAAIDATTNGKIVVILVPPGTYAGDLATLSVGTRAIAWVELGQVTYSTSEPPGARAFASNEGNIARPWFMGSWGYANNTGWTTGTSTDSPLLFAFKVTDHTGGTQGGSVVGAAVSIRNDVGANVDNFENGLTVALNHASDGAASTPNFVGAQIVGRRTALGAGAARTYGANISVRDESGRASNVQLGGVTGLEINLRASGPDTNGVRSCLSLIPSEYTTSGDGASTIESGLRITPSAALGSAGININSGILIEAEVGSITGTYTDTIKITAAASGQHVNIDAPGQPGKIRIGSQLDTGQISTLQFVGHDSGGAKTIYAEVRGVIVDATDTSEDGRWQVLTAIAGTLTEVARADASGFEVIGLLRGDSFRIDQAASSIGTGVKTISNAADSSTNFGKYLSISANGTTVYLPCSTVAPT